MEKQRQDRPSGLGLSLFLWESLCGGSHSTGARADKILRVSPKKNGRRKTEGCASGTTTKKGIEKWTS
jgi:hypothetical protein